MLYIGDGAFKVTIDTEVSEYPILEWYPGERVEIIRQHEGKLLLVDRPGPGTTLRMELKREGPKA